MTEKKKHKKVKKVKEVAVDLEQKLMQEKAIQTIVKTLNDSGLTLKVEHQVVIVPIKRS